MRLTEIQCLDSNYSESDLRDGAAVAASTLGGTPISAIVWSNVQYADAEKHLREGYVKSMEQGFRKERILTMKNDKTRPEVDKDEHLVVRDLDLEPLGGHSQSVSPGRIVAQADWRYWASFALDPEEPVDGTSTTTRTPGHNADLQAFLYGKIESTLLEAFSGLPMFGLLGISTLTPSHLRQGIAKRLTQWIVPYADRFAVPVVLYASPLGLYLYRTCGGYVEYPELDAIVDLTEWGGESLHRHSMMIRWPQDMERLPSEWKMWRDKYGEGIVFQKQ